MVKYTDLANAYRGKRVLVTGHTGFKGSWLSHWLTQMGAEVCGYALSPIGEYSHFNLLKPEYKSVIANILDTNTLNNCIQQFKPEVIFHLAAQALVLQSYQNPAETFQVNTMGTVNVLEACRFVQTTKAFVHISSDKCYDNKEWIYPYRENDALGGFDPYSASKGCTEIIVDSYRNSFFHPNQYQKTHQTLIASARAGNVIGGGDWSENRLVPDIIKATLRHEAVKIRSPKAVRPWQHVLEPLYGYLLLGKELMQGNILAAAAWNFGAQPNESYSVEQMVRAAKEVWPKIKYEINEPENKVHEAAILRIDSTKAMVHLGWKSNWNQQALLQTIEWYRSFFEEGKIITQLQLESYINRIGD